MQFKSLWQHIMTYSFEIWVKYSAHWKQITPFALITVCNIYIYTYICAYENLQVHWVVGCVTLAIICLVVLVNMGTGCRLLRTAGEFVCRKLRSNACPSLMWMVASHVACMTRGRCLRASIGRFPLKPHITSIVLMVSEVWSCYFLHRCVYSCIRATALMSLVSGLNEIESGMIWFLMQISCCTWANCHAMCHVP